jgi:hypothetical protein
VHLQQRLGISEWRACRTIGQPRSTQRKPHGVRDDEAPLTAAIIQLANVAFQFDITLHKRTPFAPTLARRISCQIPTRANPCARTIFEGRRQM